MNLSAETLFAWLEASAADPLVLAAALALATLATEDGALIAGSLLVGSGMASAELAISALAFGIVAGDIGLYAVGWSARSNRFLRQRLPVKKTRGLRRWLKGKETPVLFFSRFMPGTRLVTYLTFGFLKLSLARFVAVMSVAAVIWVTAMVLFISEIQKAFSAYGAWIGAAAGITAALAGIIILRKWLARRAANNSLQNADTISEGTNDKYANHTTAAL